MFSIQSTRGDAAPRPLSGQKNPASRYTLAVTVEKGFSEVSDLVRSALADQGFGIITEIDMSATLKTKLDVDIPPHLILGACRPALAHQALVADPSIAALLPCNVVVRAIDARRPQLSRSIRPSWRLW